MENNILLSIIIPVYNAERYLQKCLDSMVNHMTTQKIQIIAVDDGSIDKSSEILQEYKTNYGITVVSQENAGVSSARNAGIKAAVGKYITFVDADDIVLEDFWASMEQWENSEAEMIIYNYIDIDKNDNCIQKVCATKDIKTIQDVKSSFLSGHIFNTCWGKIYLKRIVKDNQIEFPLDMCVGEDMYWMANVITNIQKIKCVDCNAYGYRQNEAGAMVQLRKELNSARISDFAKEIKIKTRIGEDMNWSNEIRDSFYQRFADNSVAKINFAIKAIDDFDILCEQVDDFLLNETVSDLLKNAIQCKSINFKRRLICIVLMNRQFRKVYLKMKYSACR